MISALGVYGQRKMLALLLLGFSSGLPSLLVGQVLQAWLTGAGVDISTIGYFSLVALPYAAKPLWAPLLDRYSMPWAGRRRSWLFMTQAALLCAIAVLSTQDPMTGMPAFIAAAVAVAFCSASQDIVVDAYRADVLHQHEVGAGSASYVTGFRIAAVLGSWLPLAMAEHMSWSATYLAMTAFLAVGVIGTLLAHEPPAPVGLPQGFVDAVQLPFVNFVTRRGLLGTAAILAFVVLYKLGDQLLANVSMPFLLKQMGFNKGLVGGIQGGIGLAMAIAGTVTGGAILARIGTNRCLWIFGVLQAGSNVGYWVLAKVGPSVACLTWVIGIENFCAGLVTAAFLGFLISLCDPRYSATQFALLSGLMVLGRSLVAAPAGVLAQKVGWEIFFLVSIAAAIPGMALLPFFAPWSKPSPPAGNASGTGAD